ncbi:MAG: LuxR C-terminal-related transcriptional regulator [Parasphingorhabdus sp.]
MSQADTVETQISTTWFSKSKTRAPKFSIQLVERKRLLLALDAALDKPISCIVAPAGFGKSTLLSQWRDSLTARDIRCAWINLDDNDSEIRKFFAYLVFAFEDAGVSFGYLRKAAESGFVDMSSAAITTSLLSAIIDIEDHMVLVLDDYHRAASEQIDNFVQTLSDQCGDKVHIAIGSRTPVNINLPTLLAAGQAIEIPSANLRFSDREVNEAMGSELDEEALAALQEQLEGWPVAVQMTRLFNPVNEVINWKTASQGHLADYLVTNVLENQPDELREFILETCILKSFNVELADAVCGHHTSQSLINQLQSLQALVIPLDDDLEWFRYHHLFSECVSEVLKREDLNKFTELHRRAAKWCGENRLISEAVNYANAIEDYELSIKIINENCQWLRAEQFGGAGYFKGLLANIPEAEIVKDPRILYSKVHTNMMIGEFKKALHYHSIAESLIESGGVTPELFLDRLTIGTGLLATVEFEKERGGGWLNERLGISDAVAKENSEAYVMCGLIRTILAIQSLSYGEFDVARNHIIAAESDFDHVIARVPFLYCQFGFGIIELWSNAPDKARRRFENTADAAIEICGDNSNFKNGCDLFLAVIDYWESDLNADPNYRLEQFVMRTVEGEAAYEVYSAGFDAIVHDALRHGEFEKAEGFVEELEKWTDRLAIERLVQFAQLLRLDCVVASNDLARAEQVFEKVQGWLNSDAKTVDNFGWYHRTFAAFSCARYLGAIGKNEEALAYTNQGLEEVDRLDVVLFRVRGNVLKAALLEHGQRWGEAIAVLKHAIVDAARLNCSRPFAGEVSDKLLAEAISSVLENEPTHAVKDFAAKLTAAGAQKMFSTREEDVLQGIAQGKSNKEIARELDVTDNTIKFHLRNIYRKLDVKKRVPAVEKARELGILS